MQKRDRDFDPPTLSAAARQKSIEFFQIPLNFPFNRKARESLADRKFLPSHPFPKIVVDEFHHEKYDEEEAPGGYLSLRGKRMPNSFWGTESMISRTSKLLVVSAHPADFVWRAGGTIAKYVKQGCGVALVILSYGVRGESNDLWNAEGQTVPNVKKIRQSEIEAAAKHLGLENFEIWDFDDYYMELTPERMDRMVRKIRQVKPHSIITHGPKDVFNPDHERVSRFVFEASVLSISNGVRIEGFPTAKQARIFGFEPHQSEICDFKPEVIIDITDTFEQKAAAMQVFKAQRHLIDYYTDRAKMRGNHARRCSGNPKYQYAEAFSRFFPYVGEELV